MRGGLTEDVQEWKLRELAGDGRAVLSWVPMLCGVGYEEPTHLLPLAQLGAEATRGGVRACVSAPIRFGKSVLCHVIAARFLALRPNRTVLYCSHSEEAAQVHGREVLRLARQANVALRADQQKASRWTTASGGGLIASGLSASTATGFGADLVIVDDPHGSRLAADSETERASTMATLRGTILSRCQPGASVLAVSARWHDLDVLGQLTEDGWPYTNIECRDDAGHSIWPSRWPDDVLAEQEKTLGSYDAASLLYGRPRPRGQQMLPPPQTYTDDELRAAFEPRHSTLPPWVQALDRPPLQRIVISVDPAAGLRASKGDFSAVSVCLMRGLGSRLEMWLLDLVCERLPMPALVKKVAELRHQWGASYVLVEAVGGFSTMPDLLKSLDANMRVFPTHPKGTKEFRAEGVAAAAGRGAFKIPAGPRPWLHRFHEQWDVFPSGAHDDVPDSLAMAWNAFALGRGSGNPVPTLAARYPWLAGSAVPQ